MGGGKAPTLADDVYLTETYGVSLPKTLDMARSAHERLRVVLDNLLGRYHTSSHIMDSSNKALTEWDADLVE